LKEWIKVDFRNTPSTTNLEEEEIVGAPENAGNASMPEQVKRPNPWRRRKKKMMMVKWVPVTTAWCVLRLRMKERPPIWSTEANILKKNSRGQPKSGGPPARGLGEMLTTTHCQNVSLYEMFKQKASYLD
jgi:hypothetical protein